MKTTTRIFVTNSHPQPHVTQNDEGTLTLHIESETGDIELTMSKTQALGIGAVLVDKSAASILWSISDAIDAPADLSARALRRVTRSK